MMSYDLTASDELPRQLRTARILLHLGAAFTVLVVVGTLLVTGASPEVLGRLTWIAWPGVAAFVIALRMPRGGPGLFRATLVVCGFWILAALAALGQGSPRGITQLIIPVTVLVLVTRPASRDFFDGN